MLRDRYTSSGHRTQSVPGLSCAGRVGAQGTSTGSRGRSCFSCSQYYSRLFSDADYSVHHGAYSFIEVVNIIAPQKSAVFSTVRVNPDVLCAPTTHTTTKIPQPE